MTSVCKKWRGGSGLASETRLDHSQEESSRALYTRTLADCDFEDMSKKLNSRVPRHRPPRPRKAAQLSRPLKAELTQESPPTTLCKAIEYFGPSLPMAFVVTEGDYRPRGSEGMAEGEEHAAASNYAVYLD